jgi:hypothetical protein
MARGNGLRTARSPRARARRILKKNVIIKTRPPRSLRETHPEPRKKAPEELHHGNHTRVACFRLSPTTPARAVDVRDVDDRA